MGRLTLRFISGTDVERLALTRAEIFEAVTEAVRAQGQGEVVLEPRVHLNPPNGGRGHFNILRAHLGTAHVSGVKVVGDFVDNHRQGLPSELALITLYDPDTGMPLAIVDGTMITAARTGAVTALGAKHLARSDSRILGHVGARGTAWWNVTMLDDLFDFAEIRVTSRRPESRETFARQLSEELGKPVTAVPTPEAALKGADIMVEATRLTSPTVLLRTEWVTPGTLVVPYGTISAVELSLTAVMDKIVVDDWGQCKGGKFGSLRAHVEAGKLSEHTLHAELGQIVAGLKPGRQSDAETNLFWHRGLSLSDIALGHAMLEKSHRLGIGQRLRFA